jgi:catecholate siderophore receptor
MTHNALSRPAALLLAASTLTLAFAGSLNAETGSNAAANSEPVELTDFIVKDSYLYSDQVNALKTPTPILDVPQSLSITTAEQIQERGFTNIRDLVDYTPGVTTSQGEGHRDAVVIRGVRATADFFIDGVRDDVQYYRSLYTVEQVEFLRGPNALLFGRGGTGGIVNRVLKKGTVGQNFNEYQVTVDSFGAYSAQIDSNIAISDASAFRINASYEHLDNHRDYYDGDRWGVNPTFKFQLTENTVLDLSYEYVDHQRFIDRGVPTGTDGEPVEAFEDQFFGDKNQNNTELRAHIFRALLEHRFSDQLKGRVDLAYGDYDKAYENFYASGYDQAGSPDEVDLAGYVDTTQRQNFTLAGTLVGELETGSIGHTLVAGAEYIHSDNDNDRFVAPTTTFTIDSYNDVTGLTFNTFRDRTEAEVDTVSFFIQNEIALSEKLDVVLGARFDRFDITGDELDEPGNVVDTRNRVDEEITPRLGVVFKPQENISLYASYSETFLPASGEQFASVPDRDTALEPEEFTNLEAGLKWDFDNGLSVTAAIFQLEKSSPETDQDDALATTIVESSIQGFEAQLLGQFTENWTVSAGYSYLDGEVEDQDPSIDGNRPRELPEHMFSIWNRYQLTGKLGLGLGFIYYDDVFIATDNDTKLPSYFRVDAAAYYELTDNLRLQLNVENLTDELYFPHAHADHQASVGAPIHARIAISGRF